MANNKNEKTIAELYKFLEENMATKEDLAELRANMATKKEVGGLINEMKAEVGGLRKEIGSLKKEMKQEIGDLQKDINDLELFLQAYVATKEDIHESERKLRKEMGIMKTDLKDFVDEKLSNLQGNIIVLMRKEDHKVLYLIKLLKEKKILSDKEVRELIKMQPFPKMTL